MDDSKLQNYTADAQNSKWQTNNLLFLHFFCWTKEIWKALNDIIFDEVKRQLYVPTEIQLPISQCYIQSEHFGPVQFKQIMKNKLINLRKVSHIKVPQRIVYMEIE